MKIKNLLCLCLLWPMFSNVNAQVATKYTYTPNSVSAAYTLLTTGQTNIVTGNGANTSNAWYQGGVANTTGAGIPIGFNFQFNCLPYTTIGVHTNGFIWFGTGNPSTTSLAPISNASANLGGSGTIDGLVAGYSGNTVTRIPIGAGSAIRYRVDGSSPNRIFKIEWAGYKMTGTFNGSGTIPSTQIWLYETSNNIEFYINNMQSILINGTRTGQLGIRGATNADFKNCILASASTWANIPAGTLNTQTVQTSSSPGCWPNPNRMVAWISTNSCCAAPTIQASNYGFSGSTATQATISWTRGNGTGGVVVVAHAGTPVSADPVSGTDYTAGQNSIFSSGTNLGSNNYVVYAGTGTSVTVTGLSGSANFFSVYEYNSAATCYNTPGLSGAVIQPIHSPSFNCAYTGSGQSITYSSVSATTTVATGTGITNTNYPGQLFPSGFNFKFNGVNYTSCGVNSNGYIWFGSGSPLASANNPLSNASANLGGSGIIDGIIAPFGTALSASTAMASVTPSIIMNLTGSSPNRVLTVQWTGFAPATGSSGLCAIFGFTNDLNRVDFQIKLYEDGGTNSNRIEFNYVNQTPWCVDATYNVQVGIRGSSNTEFLNRSGSSTNWGQGTTAGTINTAICSFDPSTFIHANVAFRYEYSGALPSVTPSPTASNICPATSATLTSSSLSNNQWIGAGSFIPGATSQTYAANQSGDHYVVVNFGGCYTSSNVTTVTITSCGSAPTITFCPGNTPVNNDAGQCNAVVNYPPATATGTPTPTITYSQNSGTSFALGTTTVTVTASNGTLPDATCTFDVIVTDSENPVPDIASLSDVTGECSASATAPTATDNCAGSITATTVDPTSYNTQGTHIIHWIYDDGNGNTSAQNQNVIIDDVTAPVITGCPVNFSSCNPVSWTAPTGNDNCAGAVTPTSNHNPGETFPSGTTLVTYTFDDGNGNISQCNFNVTLIPAPTAVLSNNSSICLGNAANVQLTFTGLGPWTYTINGNGGPYSATTSNNPENVSITPIATGTHVYTITSLTDANCTGSGTGSATVIVSTAPPANTVSSVGGTAGACSGDEVLMTANVIAGQNINYSWNTGSNSSVVKFSTVAGGPFSPGPFLTTANSVYAQFGALAGGSSGYNICVQGTNGCGSTNNKCTWVRGVVSPPSTINGPAIVCSGATGVAYNVPAVPSATLYTWSFPGATITGQGTQSVTIDFPAFSTGSLCVTAALACGGSSTSAPKCMSLSNATANPGAMSGPTKICPGQTGTVYSVPLITGAATYNWTVPTGATITGGIGTNTITVSWPNPYTLNANVCVTATSICGIVSASRCKSVISSIPTTPASISGLSSGVCGQTIVYSVANVSGATSYTWGVPAGGTINSGQGSNSINVTWGLISSVQINVTANNACGSSGLRTLNITGAPPIPGTITSAFTVCNGLPANFSINPVAGATGYTWAVPANGTTIDNGQGTTSIDVIWGTGAGTVTVKATNACGNSNNRSLAVTTGCRLEGTVVTSANMVVYPNPANEHVTLSFNAAAGNCEIDIIDLSGRIIKTIPINAKEGRNDIEVDLRRIAKGVYMVELRTATNIEKSKLIIE